MPSTNGLYYSLSEGGKLDQPPVVLLHGAGCDHTIWPASLRRLPGQRVYALDLPAHGRSQGAGLQSVHAYAQRVVEWMAALDLFQAVFVGHEMGAAIALAIATTYPAQVVGLGLISGGAALQPPADLLARMDLPGADAEVRAMLVERCFGLANSALADAYFSAMKNTRPSVLAGDWRACQSCDLRAEVYRITAPVWVAAGSLDSVTPLACSQFLAGQLPQARLQILTGVGHLPMLEAPGAVAAGLGPLLVESHPAFLRVDRDALIRSRKEV